jgi:pimeloyl-ACP methyl ester carboxylesterase
MNAGRRSLVAGCMAIVAGTIAVAAAEPASPKIGVVVMHGKGGSPVKNVASLAVALERKGYLVVSPDLPWSGLRQYDLPVSGAEQEVEAAIDGLRQRGARKVFVAGHSQGGAFALYFGSTHPVDGVIAIAPGTSVAAPGFAARIAPSLERAQKLVSKGKGAEKATFTDHEGSRGEYDVTTTAASYVTWFEPEGAMNRDLSAKRMPPGVPVLFVGPKRDYEPLVRAKRRTFDLLPPNPMTRLFEPDSDHKGAPSASIDEIVRWTAQVAAGETVPPASRAGGSLIDLLRYRLDFAILSIV